MPIYMDKHDIPPGIDRSEIDHAHLQDIRHQHKHCCKSLSFWYDEQRGTGFCLFEAPNKKAVEDLHAESHGMLPGKIIEVDESFVESFLGKVEDPSLHNKQAKPAFRTIMFTDLKDSTSKTTELGDKKAMDLLRVHNSIIRYIILQFSGTEIKHTGDGFMISFVSTIQSIECALEIQKEFTKYSKGNPDNSMEIRIGINAGEPIEEGDDLFGTTIQLASRICDHAKPGTILVAPAIRELCFGKGIKFESKGIVHLKGFDEPITLYEVMQ